MSADAFAVTQLDLSPPRRSPGRERDGAQTFPRSEALGTVRREALARAATQIWSTVVEQPQTQGTLGQDWVTGWRRARRLLPGKLRQIRWKLRRRRVHAGHVDGGHESPTWSRTMRRWPPLLALLAMSGACGLVSQDRQGDPSDKAPITLPDLSKSKKAIERAATPWTYVLPLDYGVRTDRSGQGHFRAPRFHGEHNGLDLLAPIGTPVFSPCDGEAMRGASRSFGRWMHVICPIPDDYRDTSGPRPWASFFYAHLSDTETPHNQWVKVSRGQKLGAVGKSGNASTGSVQPHLHLELIIQANHRAAMDEHHLGSDQSDVPAAAAFAQALSEKCLDPFGFRPKTSQLRRARRLDPFVALTCLSPAKPDFVKAPKPLDVHSNAWTNFYAAENFNVNRGPDSL